MRGALLDCCALDWAAISPAIFGALFQSIMDDQARRNLGAHYTSEERVAFLFTLYQKYTSLLPAETKRASRPRR